jgi:hypothetical protein
MALSMTKSPMALAQEALQVAKATLKPYSNKYSPKRYTQPQLFAILVLRQFFNIDYRGIEQLLRDFSDLRQVLNLKQVPDHTTICRAHQRLLKKGLSRAS